MNQKRKTGSGLIETGMFAGMVGVVAAVMVMVAFAKGLVTAVFIGGAVAVIVFAAMMLMLGGTAQPPRGPGNIAPNKTAIGQGADSTKPAAKAAPDAAPKAAAKPATSKAPKPAADGLDADIGTKPQMLSAPRGDGPDDLKKIKGVGPKLEELMHSMGFYHYDQIAAWTADEVAWVDENLIGFKGRVTRDDWVAQARDLAKGSA